MKRSCRLYFCLDSIEGRFDKAQSYVCEFNEISSNINSSVSRYTRVGSKISVLVLGLGRQTFNISRQPMTMG